MGGFNNPVVGGGGDLVRERIRSPGYQANTAGWSVNQDGSAEFNNVTVRGELDVGTANSYVRARIEPPSSPSPGPVIALNADAGAYPVDGFIHGSIFGGGSITLSSPYNAATVNVPASLDLVSGDPALPPITGRAARVGGGLYVNGDLQIEPAAGNTVLSADDTGVDVTGDLDVTGNVILPQGKRVKRGPLATLTLLEGWSNFGGGYQGAVYAEMPDGTGALFGVIAAGTTAAGTIIANVGASVRPSLAHVFTCTSNGGNPVQLALANNGNIVLQSPPGGLAWIAFGGGCRWPIAGF